VIFALNKKIVVNRCCTLKTPEVVFITPESDENNRVINQNGLFSFSQNGVELQSWIESIFHGSQEKALIKILVPNDERENCLKNLNTMNINHITLFPDLYGASMYTNMRVFLK
jgi:hypothetical protein